MAIKRKISEERKQQLRDQLEKARAKRKPAEYKNIHASVLALPDEDNYSLKNVKEWIKESKEKVAAFNKVARSFRSTPQDKQRASNDADAKKAYIRYCEHYLRTGDWIGIKSGLHEEHLVIPKCVAMAYNPDGTPKRTVGVYYSDLHAVWTKEMDNGQSPSVSE